MKRIKRVLGSAAFLAIGLVLTILTCYVLRPENAFSFRDKFIGFYGEEDDSLDVVGLGSSALYRYLSSPLLYEYSGLTSYPLGTPGQSIFVIEHLIDEILKTQSPELLVIEARRFLFTNKETEFAKVREKNRLRMVTDNMNYSANRFLLVNELVDSRWENWLTYYFDIMLYHDNWEELNINSFAYMLNSKEEPTKAWRNVSLLMPLTRPEIGNATDEAPLSEESEEVLLSVMEKCRENGQEVLFVATPFCIGPEAQKRANYMRRIVEEHGFQFLDCNLCVDDIGIDFGMDFYNKKHTNAIGAGKFTKYLGEYILEHYDIDTSHSPEVTDAWNDMAEENRVLYEAACEKIRQKALAKAG